MNSAYPGGCEYGGDDLTPIDRYGTPITAQQVLAYQSQLRINASQVEGLSVYLGSGGGTLSLPFKNVKDAAWGAHGDGIADDTTVIQAAIDAAWLAGGGTVVLPSATYIINPTRQVYIPFNPGRNEWAYGLRMRPGVSLVGEAGAKLKGVCSGPNPKNPYSVVYIADGVTDVLVEGFTIEGDLTPPTPGESGMCVYVGESQRVTLRNLTLVNAFGDGICAGNDGLKTAAHALTIENCDTRLCRRNGLSVAYATQMRIRGGYYQAPTVPFGTSPYCGVDIECIPSDIWNEDILFSGVTFASQPHGGDAVAVKASYRHVRFEGCTMRTQDGDEYVLTTDIARRAVAVSNVGVDGDVPSFDGCTFIGPVVVDCGTFSRCKGYLKSLTSYQTLFTAITDQKVELLDCRFVASGNASPVFLDGSTVPLREKVVTNSHFVLDGNLLADGASAAFFKGYCYVRGGSLMHTGAAPATGWFMGEDFSTGKTRFDGVFVHHLMRLGMPADSVVTYDASTGRWSSNGHGNNTTAPTLGAADISVGIPADHGIQVLVGPLSSTVHVTLQTAGAFEGATFTFRRTAASTGAPLWDIGGLKGLATSQWCKVRYNAALTQWELDSFGSL